MLKLECSSCGAPIDSHRMQCPYCKTKYSKDFSPFRQDNHKVYGTQVNIGGDVNNSSIITGNNNIITDSGAFIGRSVIVNGGFIGGTKGKIIIK